MQKQKTKSKKISVEEQIANENVAPIILNLLGSFSGDEMSQAINENVNLSKGLEQDVQLLNQIRLCLIFIPDDNKKKLGENIKKKKWIDWFLNNVLKNKRPDLYNRIIYHPKGSRYICKELRKIVTIVFD